MAAIPIPHIVAFLQETAFFASTEAAALEVLATQFEPVFVESGHLLIKEGDQGDCLYLVISGHLRTIKQSSHGDTIILSEINRGELIGELALLTQDPRAASVIATRDSLLLKLSKQAFDEFIYARPAAIMPIVKASLQRVLRKQVRKQDNSAVITFAPAGKYCPQFHTFTRHFIQALANHASVLLLNRELIDEQLKKAGIILSTANYQDTRVLQWLNDQESNHRFIIYQTDDTDSEWTQFSLRQADKIMLIASSDQDTSINSIEQGIFKQSPAIRKSIELVLIQPNHIQLPSMTNQWLRDRPVNLHHHVKLGAPETLQKLARYLSGKAVGLVCGGGGARGLSYIGVYKALRELNIPIDLIGGTSAGAMIAAFFGYNHEPDHIVDIIKTGLLQNKKAFQYTIPIVSFISGIEWAKELKNCYGENVLVEDLWVNLFCIATNMTQNKMNILREGVVWKAVRASISLPAIVPPVSNDQNELLVDGGVVNNLPIDVMRNSINGGKIIAARLPIQSTVKADIPEGAVSGWDVCLQRLNPFDKSNSAMPNLAEIIINTIMVSSQLHESLVIKQADYHIDLDLSAYTILDFKPIDQLVELGYRQTLEQLTKLDIKLS